MLCWWTVGWEWAFDVGHEFCVVSVLNSLFDWEEIVCEHTMLPLSTSTESWELGTGLCAEAALTELIRRTCDV